MTSPLYKKELLVMWKKIVAGVGTLVLFGSIASGIYFMEAHYAKADDTKQNANDIKINQHKNDIRWYQDQMSYIMTRCGTRDPNKLPQGDYQSYQNYKIQKEALDSELKILMQGRNKF